MILRSIFSGEHSISLPPSFTLVTMRQFVDDAVELQREKNTSRIIFDFSNLKFIEPCGVVVLCNTIEYFRDKGVRVSFAGHNVNNSGNRYLDDSGFFTRYLKAPVFKGSAMRATTVPLEIFDAKAYVPYLYRKLMPWVGQEVRLSTDTLDTIRTCLEEIFHNIDYHSGVSTGCTFSQHFPNKNCIHVAISDFGIGIPERVRTRLPQLGDAAAVRQAVQEGFTTQSNVRNRGAGLPNLIRYVVQRNGGAVLIHSGKGYLSATKGAAAPSITSREMTTLYPGTFVHVVLRTDTMETLENDVLPEEFQW